MSESTKSVVTVSEMARMVGLSRSRFYQRIGAAFPHPVYDVETRRPRFTADQQVVCLDVRRRNCGIDGTPVMFYSQRPMPTLSQTRPKKPQTKPASPKSDDRLSEGTEGVRALGLASVTDRQVSQAVRHLFPGGIANVDSGEVVRAVFVRLMRQNSTDNLGR